MAMAIFMLVHLSSWNIFISFVFRYVTDKMFLQIK